MYACIRVCEGVFVCVCMSVHMHHLYALRGSVCSWCLCESWNPREGDSVIMISKDRKMMSWLRKKAETYCAWTLSFHVGP